MYALKLFSKYCCFIIALLSAIKEPTVISQYTPTSYNKLKESYTQVYNIANQVGYSPNQQLFVALQYKKNSFAVFNGLTLAKIGSFNISDDESDYAYSFSFAPDNSLLIVGTYQGTLLCYKINDNVIDPVPGTIKQNTNSEYIGAISVSSTLQIAAGGSGIALSLYTINDDKSFKLVHQLQFRKFIQALSYNSDGSSLYVGANMYDSGLFASILTVNPFTITQISQQTTRQGGVVAYSSYIVQALVSGPIKIYYAENYTVAGTIKQQAYPISVSKNGKYLVACVDTCYYVKVWDITNVGDPSVFFPLYTLGPVGEFGELGVSETGSNFIKANNNNGYLILYGLCKADQFYKSKTNECFKCNQLCTICLGTAQTCYECKKDVFLVGTTCKTCSSIIVGCADCLDQKTCMACNQTAHFTMLDGKCNCQKAFYQNNQACVSCEKAIKDCIECINGEKCTSCKTSSLLQNKTCVPCSEYIKNCAQCSSQTEVVCVSCFDTFILSIDRNSCVCPQNFNLDNKRCVQKQNNLGQIIAVIVAVAIALGLCAICCMKFRKKRKHYSQQNFENDYNKISQGPLKSESILSSLQNDQPYFNQPIKTTESSQSQKLQSETPQPQIKIGISPLSQSQANHHDHMIKNM